MAAVQLPLDLQFRPAYGREDFLITRSNQDAVAMVDAWPQSWGGFPALTIFGAVGSGKSHLAAVWAQKTQAKILTPDAFEKSLFQDLVGQPHHVVLERLDLLTGDAEREQKIFHLYNALGAAKKSVLLTSHIAPGQMNFGLRDLQSRLRASPAVHIHQPDDDLLCYVFAKQLHDRGLSVSDKVVRYAVGRMERSWAAMDAMIAELSTRATAEKKGITMPLVREVLKDPDQDDPEDALGNESL